MNYGRIRKRKAKALKQLSIFFIEKGRILPYEEYRKLGFRQPVYGSSIKTLFKTYNNMVQILEEDEALMALIAQSGAIQAEYKEEAAATPDPLATLRASTTEK